MKEDKKETIVKRQFEALLARKPLSEKLSTEVEMYREALRQRSLCESERIKEDGRILNLFSKEYPEWPGIGKKTSEWPKNWKEPRWQYIALETLIGELSFSGYEDRRSMSNWRGSRRERLCKLVDEGVPRRTVRRHLAVAAETIDHIAGVRLRDPLGRVIEEFERLSRVWPEGATKRLVGKVRHEGMPQKKTSAPPSSAKGNRTTSESCPYSSYTEMQSGFPTWVKEQTKDLPINYCLLISDGIERRIRAFEERGVPLSRAYSHMKNAVRARVCSAKKCPNQEFQASPGEDDTHAACALLGVACSPEGHFKIEEAQKAFKREARLTHPDKHPEEEKAKYNQKFIEINRAWTILKAAHESYGQGE